MSKFEKMFSRRRIMLLEMGGLGDLVLLSELVSSLRHGAEPPEITLLCRAPFEQLPALYPDPPDRVVPVGINPYLTATPAPELLDTVRTISGKIAEIPCDLLLACDHAPNWLDHIVAASLGRQVRALGAARAEPGALARILEFELALDETSFEDVAAGPHERDRYAALARAAGVEPRPGFPWTKPPAGALPALGVAPGGYLVCFPLGVAATPEKRWPAARYAEVLSKQNLPVVLCGENAEGPELGRLAAETGAAAVFTGGPSDLPALAALLAHARAWLGNDTGPMHLAQAYEVPGVAIFGGGTWPSYAPWNAGAIGLVSPLPCFGCRWDCFAGRGLCVEAISVTAVGDALARVLEAPPAVPVSEEIRFDDPPAAWIAGASGRYRAAQADRAARLEALIGLEWKAAQLPRAEEARRELEDLAGERLRSWQETQRELESVGRAARERSELIARLSAEIETRDALAENLRRELDAVRQDRSRTEAIEQAALERLRALEAMSVELESIRAIAEERRLLCDRLSSDHASSRAMIRELMAAACDRGTRLSDAVAEADRLREIARERERDASAAQAALLASSEEAERLRGIAGEREAALARSTAEAGALRAAAHDLHEALLRAGAALAASTAEADRLRVIAQEREHALLQAQAALAASTAEAGRLRTVAQEREQSLTQAHAALAKSGAEAGSLRAIAQERELALHRSTAEAGNLRRIAGEREQALTDAAAETSRITQIAREREQALLATTAELRRLEAKLAEHLRHFEEEEQRLGSELAAALERQRLESRTHREEADALGRRLELATAAKQAAEGLVIALEKRTLLDFMLHRKLKTGTLP